MPVHKPYYLKVIIATCKAIAFIPFGFQYIFIKMGLIEAPGWINEIPGFNFRNLKRIWDVRIIKRFISFSVRSPLRKSILKLVNFDLCFPDNSGGVIVICHTPWKRLLVQWCLKEKNIMIISSGNWNGRKKSLQNKATGYRELRRVINHLRQNGKIVICLTRFNEMNDCRVSLLGDERNLSILPVRLSKAGKVPLTMAIPVFREGIIQFIKGPETRFADSDPCKMTQHLGNFLNDTIRKDPTLWPPCLR